MPLPRCSQRVLQALGPYPAPVASPAHQLLPAAWAPLRRHGDLPAGCGVAGHVQGARPYDGHGGADSTPRRPSRLSRGREGRLPFTVCHSWCWVSRWGALDLVRGVVAPPLADDVGLNQRCRRGWLDTPPNAAGDPTSARRSRLVCVAAGCYVSKTDRWPPRTSFRAQAAAAYLSRPPLPVAGKATGMTGATP